MSGFSNLQSTATPEQQEAANATKKLEKLVEDFIMENQKVTKINLSLTRTVIYLTISNVIIIIFEIYNKL